MRRFTGLRQLALSGPFSDGLRLDNVSVRFARTMVFDNVSLEAPIGSVLRVTGDNGSGKTTLMRVAANVAPPTSGTRHGPQRCTYIPGAVKPAPGSGRRWLEAPVRRWRDPLSLLDRLGFQGRLDAAASELSFGNWRKVLIAHALSAEGTLTMIDEATTGLDERGISELSVLLAETAARGTAVIVADAGISEIVTDGTYVLGTQMRSTGEVVRPAPQRVTFSGTQSQLDELRSHAARVGAAVETAEPE